MMLCSSWPYPVAECQNRWRLAHSMRCPRIRPNPQLTIDRAIFAVCAMLATGHGPDVEVHLMVEFCYCYLMMASENQMVNGMVMLQLVAPHPVDMRPHSVTVMLVSNRFPNHRHANDHRIRSYGDVQFHEHGVWCRFDLHLMVETRSSGHRLHRAANPTYHEMNNGK